MGNGFSHLIPCLRPENQNRNNEPDVVFTATEPLDETLGHSFCYVRSSARFLSPTPSDRFLSPTSSLRFSPERSDPKPALSVDAAAGVPHPLRTGHGHQESATGFRFISGASVSANTSTPRTVVQLDDVYDDASDLASAGPYGTRGAGSIVNGFESSSNFSALPLQPVPRGEQSGPIEGSGGFFLSGPIESGALSGPLDSSSAGGDNGRVPFSAPLGLGGPYIKNKRRKKSLSGFRKAFQRSLSEKKRPWVVPVRNFVGRKEDSTGGGNAAAGDGGGAPAGGVASEVMNYEGDSNVQWALGKAGEDRVHVVVSEEHGWLFVGIYDGFNGPDAPEFLMGHLYRAVFNELKGLFWDSDSEINAPIDRQTSLDIASDTAEAAGEQQNTNIRTAGAVEAQQNTNINTEISNDGCENQMLAAAKRVTFQSSEKKEIRRKLWEFLAEEQAEDGLDLSGSDRFAFSVDDAVSASNAGSAMSRRSLLLSKLKHGLTRSKDGRHSKRMFPRRFPDEEKENPENETKIEEERVCRSGRRRKSGPVDHSSVLNALSRALEKTELAYLDLTDRVLDRYPELALMGSCLLVVLMRDDDVYVMNLGDSRAIVAQFEPSQCSDTMEGNDKRKNGSADGIIEESTSAGEKLDNEANKVPPQSKKLTALQLSTDHSTSIEDEVLRIKSEHPDDNRCIVNDRVKGRLKVTRAFGAGFLKQAKFNDALLEMFRNDFIGTAPYVSCIPSVCHYKLGARDQFLVLSSDGLYQYLTNEEVVSHVASFWERNPEGDPAQHLIEELLTRAAKKAGMNFHDLLDIPHGDRRKYHDDVTVMVVSLEGLIWKSSGKYP